MFHVHMGYDNLCEEKKHGEQLLLFELRNDVIVDCLLFRTRL